MTKTLIGAHVGVPGGLVKGGLGNAAQLGAEVVQFFVANPRGWATPPADPADEEAFRIASAELGIPAFVHSPYLINFGSPTPETVAKSIISLRHSLHRGAAAGVRGVVVHTGSAVTPGTVDRAMRQVRDAVLPLVDELGELEKCYGSAPMLLLEPTAGQGQSLCSTISELGSYLDALDRHERVGICLDTCHAFAAGHDLAKPGGMALALDELAHIAGPERLRLIHANDSKDVCGAAKDRHANIGKGHIGEAAFAELLAHPLAAGVPMVIETPGKAEAWAEDVALLKALRPVKQ